jgi:hypothetical protein
MRVNAQLSSAETGRQLWAERFDQTVADLFDTQDEIVGRLARQLNVALATPEVIRAERAQHPDTTDMLTERMAWFNKGPTPYKLEAALACFKRALTINPQNVAAFARMALICAFAIRWVCP